MHELAVTSAVADAALRHAGGHRVTKVHLLVGRLRQVVPSSVAFLWPIVTRETLCEGSELIQEIVPGRLRCTGCDWTWEVEDPAFRCPCCAGASVETLQGDELQVESIEVEVAA